jgi:hypothetical protein
MFLKQLFIFNLIKRESLKLCLNAEVLFADKIPLSFKCLETQAYHSRHAVGTLNFKCVSLAVRVFSRSEYGQSPYITVHDLPS